MASSITSQTLYKVHTAIAKSKQRGLTVDQLITKTRLARNTVLISTRNLVKEGKVKVEKMPQHKLSSKNLYLSLQDPVEPTHDLRGKLAQIVEILEPYSKHPESWDKGFKGQIIGAIQDAIAIACKQ